MPQDRDCIESKCQVIGPDERATFRLRPQFVFRPDVFQIKASKRDPSDVKDVSDHMRLVQLEWCAVKYNDKGVDYARVGVEHVGKAGPQVDLGGIQDRTMIVAQDLLCTVENVLNEEVVVSVRAEGISMT